MGVIKIYKAQDIANWFIDRNDWEVLNGSEHLTCAKLLDLMYYAEGCSLALNNESLFNDVIFAWELSPVIIDIYETYENPNLEIKTVDFKDVISSEDKELLEEVFITFGKYTTWHLKNKIHNETPWLKATKNGTSLNKPIDRQEMKEYFRQNYI